MFILNTPIDGVRFSSFIRNSWHRVAIDDIGRDCGSDNDTPFWSCRNRYPASILAFSENGGVNISPCIHTNGLSRGLITILICQIWYIVKVRYGRQINIARWCLFVNNWLYPHNQRKSVFWIPDRRLLRRSQSKCRSGQGRSHGQRCLPPGLFGAILPIDFNRLILKDKS